MPPKDLYEKVIFPYRGYIKNKSSIPIEDLLSLDHPPWEDIAKHPQITIDIIKSNFDKIIFLDLTENYHIKVDDLYQLLVDLKMSGKINQSETLNYLQTLVNNSYINVETYLN